MHRIIDLKQLQPSNSTFENEFAIKTTTKKNSQRTNQHHNLWSKSRSIITWCYLKTPTAAMTISINRYHRAIVSHLVVVYLIQLIWLILNDCSIVLQLPSWLDCDVWYPSRLDFNLIFYYCINFYSLTYLLYSLN